ncbi:hypothetical protein M8818_005155 [Zalaria obscura]|uniref:Uncharacterized protein n=1 Tax=Zalaria obscura TaxID=2024903 RepID=A0ACC3SA10_9PEZI
MIKSLNVGRRFTPIWNHLIMRPGILPQSFHRPFTSPTTSPPVDVNPVAEVSNDELSLTSPCQHNAETGRIANESLKDFRAFWATRKARSSEIDDDVELCALHPSKREQGNFRDGLEGGDADLRSQRR